jgi:hypothetical protein
MQRFLILEIRSRAFWSSGESGKPLVLREMRERRFIARLYMRKRSRLEVVMGNLNPFELPCRVTRGLLERGYHVD